MALGAAKISILILTCNEEKSIAGCLESVSNLDAEIFIVDSGSTDRTLEIASTYNCKVYRHEWKNYGDQRNWGFDNLPISAPWVLALDAEERLTPELEKEISSLIADPDLSSKPNGYILKKRCYFMGRWIKRGGYYPNHHIRLAKKGCIRCEERSYHQHFKVEGSLGVLRYDFIDLIATSVIGWSSKLSRWAPHEANAMLNEIDNDINNVRIKPKLFGNSIERKRYLRERVYNRFPLFVRPFLLFVYQYFFRLGFLEGKEGLVFFTLQSFYFPFLTDCAIYEQKKDNSI